MWLLHGNQLEPDDIEALCLGAPRDRTLGEPLHVSAFSMAPYGQLEVRQRVEEQAHLYPYVTFS